MAYKKVFLDTNVVLDFLADRFPFNESAAKIFELNDRSKIKCYCSVITITDVYYILSRQLSKVKTLNLIKNLIKQVNLVTVSPKELIAAANYESFNDFEDGIQYFTALDMAADCIITRDKKGFKKAVNIEIVAPDEFLVKFALK